MITGSSLLSFLRQAAKFGSDPQSCMDFFGSEASDYQKIIQMLYICFIRLMKSNGLISEELSDISLCSNNSELYLRNRAVIGELIGASAHLFSKKEYNFGLCYLFLYYYQRILFKMIPRRKSDYSFVGKGDNNMPVSWRSSQEQIVVLLTGSKDRTHIHDAAAVVCEDLAVLLNQYLQSTSTRFRLIAKEITRLEGGRRVTFLCGISGMGKSDFLKTFSETHKSSRYYAKPSMFGLDELEQLFIPDEGESAFRELYLLLDDCRYITWPEKYELRDILAAVSPERNLHVICAVRDDGIRSLAEFIPEGYQIHTINMPLLDLETIRNRCERQVSDLAPELVLRAAFGYPPLVHTCFEKRTGKISGRTYWKTLCALFGNYSAADTIKLRMAVFLSKNGKIKLPLFAAAENVSGPENGSGLIEKIDLAVFLSKQEENGLISPPDEFGIRTLDPVVSFLFDKVRYYTNND